MAKKQRHAQKFKQQKSQEKKAAVSSPVEETQPGDSKGSIVIAAEDEAQANQEGRVVGLVNLGMTCFFNAAVQVLIASQPFVDEFLPPGKRGNLGQGMHEVVAASYGDPSEEQKDVKNKKSRFSGSFTPQRLHSAVVQMVPHFKAGVQQDSHELLRLLLEGLHTEQVKAARDRARGGRPEAEKKGEEPPTFVRQAFGGQLSSSLQCQACEHLAESTEDFMDLSVEILQPPGGVEAMYEPQPKGNTKGKKVKKQPVVVPTSADEAPLLSAKALKKQNKQAKKQADLERKRQRKRGGSNNAVGDDLEVVIDPAQDVLPDASQGGNEERLDEGVNGVDTTAAAAGTEEEEEVGRKAQEVSASADGTSSGDPGDEGSGATAGVDEAQPGGRRSADLESTVAEVEAAEDGLPIGSGDALQGAGGNEARTGGGAAGVERKFSALWEGEGGAAPKDQDIEAESARSSGEGGVDGAAEGTGGAIDDLRHPHKEGGAKGSGLEACLATFFTPEQVTWECPAEKKVRSSRQEAGYETPNKLLQMTSRNVSFSEEKPRVRMIPGSIEQRGTNLREAVRGDTCFCRPLKFDVAEGEAYLLVTAEVDPASLSCISVALQPQDETPGTTSVLEGDAVEVVKVAIEQIEESDDEGEQDRVAQSAQLLMDCIADMVSHEGVTRMQDMVQGGASLHPPDHPAVVRGQLNEGTGGGSWEYPLRDTPAAPSSPELLSRDSYLSCSSPASSMLANAASQNLDEPNTPAGRSATSFESIDLGGSPLRRAPKAAPPDGAPPVLQTILDGAAPTGGMAERDGSETAAGDQSPSVAPSSQPQSLPGDSPALPGTSSNSGCLDGIRSQLQGLKLGDRSTCEAGEGEAKEAGRNDDFTPQKLRAGLTNVQRQAKKGYQIRRAPQLLMVHLKRFQVDFRGKARKIQGCIPFPMQLDIKPFCDPQGAAGGSVYDLVGVVEHLGSSMKSGHYNSFVRRLARRQHGVTIGGGAQVDPSARAESSPESVSQSHQGGSSAASQAGNLADAVSASKTPGNSDDAQSIRQQDVPLATGGLVATSIPGKQVETGNTDADKEAAEERHLQDTGTSLDRQEAVGKWFRASDQHVRACTEGEVLMSEAYVLLYQRS